MTLGQGNENFSVDEWMCYCDRCGEEWGETHDELVVEYPDDFVWDEVVPARSPRTE